MALQRRTLAFVLEVVGYPTALAAVLLFSSGHTVVAVLAFVTAVALVVAGSMMGSFPTTGAFFARFAMETNNELHMVKPPGENVLDLVEGDDQGRFRGR